MRPTTLIFALIFASARAVPAEFSSHLEARGVDKLLLVTDANEAEAYRGHRDEFVAAANYGFKAVTLDRFDYSPMYKLGESIPVWTKRAEQAIAKGARYLQGPNEVNEQNLSGKAMAKLWLKAIEPILRKHPNVKGVSPSVSSKPNFAKFIKDFRKECRGCSIDLISVHQYNKAGRSVPQGIKKMKQFLSEVKKVSGGIPIAVTEFGNRTPSISAKAAYIKSATKLLRADSSVKLIAAFSHMENGDFVKNGKLTTLGRAWVNA